MANIIVKGRDTSAGKFYTIEIDGITIYGCQRKKGEKNGNPYDFITMPSRKGTDKEGKEKYWSVVSLSRELAEEVLQAVKKEEGEAVDTAEPQNLEPF